MRKPVTRRRGPGVRALLWGALLAVGLFAGARRIGPVPALGPFLDPVGGVWAVATHAALPRQATATLPGLGADVRVLYDDRGVPHIFASTSQDAARALGYVVARDRLFELELRWRTAAGRLSELVGPRALPFDRRMRHLALARAAERDFAALDSASPAFREIQAYSDGVNAWIDGLGRGDLPLEYRLLGRRPTKWKPVYSLYFLKLMGWNLAFDPSFDLDRRTVEDRVGPAAADALFPVNSPIQQPIEPNGHREPRFDYAALPPPGPPARQAAAHADDVADLARNPDLLAADPLDPLAALAPQAGLDPADQGGTGRPGAGGLGDEPVRGSNNWVVGPGRTADGHPLLAGDPHLGLTLPSIWYEVQLVVPGDLDVYGVTMPSIPNVVIGFNRDVAWSFTNTGADVLDYYKEKLDDPERPTRYEVDGVWRPLERRIETYRGPDGDVLATDTLYFTHRGPLLFRNGRALSMRWTVLEREGEAEALRGAMRATSVEGWLAAMAGFVAPAQNGVVADREGHIAIRSTGHFPYHPDGRGTEIEDGTASASDWSGYWPLERYPFALDPRQGYLASANQQPIDPQEDSTYLGSNWPSPWRAMRINALLRADSSVTPDDMRRFQTDPASERVDLFFPFLVKAPDRLSPGAVPDSTLALARAAARLLGEWDRRYTKENERAVLFEAAMDELADRTWDELQDTARSAGRRVATPATAVLAELLSQPTSAWWDDRRTPDVVEDRDVILVRSLAAALRSVRRVYGDPAGGGWRWDRIRHANVYHLLGLPSLSDLDLPMQGGPSTLSPSAGSGRHGASWRMVVDLGPEVHAWSIYPGGQSGNPVSRWYDDRIPKWVNGRLDPVLFPSTPSDLDPARVAGTLVLQPEAKR